MTGRGADLSRNARDVTDVAAYSPQVEDTLRAISAALRSYRLYSGLGPMLERFLVTASGKVAALWETFSELRLEIDEQTIRWAGVRVYPTGDSGPELAFLFYKDGIREITLLPGFEEELPILLRVLGTAPQVREDEDDLITLLWQEDFTAFKYQFVEAAVEGIEPGEDQPAREAKSVSPEAVRAAAAEPSQGFTPEDFQETLYFLDQAELQRLDDEVRRESDRDLWGAVITGLFDRLEDGSPERKARVLRILGELLPSLLGSGDFARASDVLAEMADLASRPGVLDGAALREVKAIFGQLSGAETIEQLVKLLEEDPEALRGEAVATLFSFFPPESLAPLFRSTSTITRPDVRRAFERVVERLASDNRDEVVRLLSDPDPVLVAGAARWAGQLGIGAAAGTLGDLLGHADPGVRVSAIEALAALKAGVAGKSLQPLLEDSEREVRIAAARGLATLEVASARQVLETALQSKRLRSADRSEKIAFFEAYGRLGGAEAVPLLDRTLNSKSWLGKTEPTEIRACAALGLARVRHPTAQAALASAANDSDPVVKSAVTRALRGESAE